MKGGRCDTYATSVRVWMVVISASSRLPVPLLLWPGRGLDAGALATCGWGWTTFAAAATLPAWAPCHASAAASEPRAAPCALSYASAACAAWATWASTRGLAGHVTGAGGVDAQYGRSCSLSSTETRKSTGMDAMYGKAVSPVVLSCSAAARWVSAACCWIAASIDAPRLATCKRGGVRTTGDVQKRCIGRHIASIQCALHVPVEGCSVARGGHVGWGEQTTK